MYIIPQSPSASGAYPPIQPWPGLTPPDGYDVWPDALEQDTFQQYNGFVILTVVRGTVASYQPNTEAWEAWKATLPPQPEPEPVFDYVTWTALSAAVREGVNTYEQHQ